MNTFLPYSDFSASARALDGTRLNNQCNECKVIVRAVLGESTAWAQHPAARMWVGYGQALIAYSVAVCEEALRREMQNNLLPWFQERQAGTVVLPPWLGDELLHVAHRSQIIAKLPEWYRPLFPGTPEGLPRVYPVPLRSKRAGAVFLGDLPRCARSVR